MYKPIDSCTREVKLTNLIYNTLWDSIKYKYCSYKNMNSKKGTVTNKTGYFEIESAATDSINISCI